jgi:hypothetical protein
LVPPHAGFLVGYCHDGGHFIKALPRSMSFGFGVHLSDLGMQAEMIR